MPRPPNTKSDVFSNINMHHGDVGQCWEWNGSWGGGRKLSERRPYFDVDGRKHIAYRLVFELISGKRPQQDEIIRHTCDQGGYPIGCCNPHHLVLGTHAENMRDMTNRERHGLPHHTVRAIRKLASEGISHRHIAERYGLTRENVTKIVNLKSYRHLRKESDER